MKIYEIKKLININSDYYSRAEVSQILLSMYIGYTDGYEIVTLNPYYPNDMLSGVYKNHPQKNMRIYLGNSKNVMTAYNIYMYMMNIDSSLRDKSLFRIHKERFRKVFTRFSSIK